MLKIKNLSVKAGKKKILDGISLNLREGEIQVLMGPNGSGKTTLAQTLAGQTFYKPSGSASIDGKEILKLSPDKRAKLGLFISFQNPISVPGVAIFDFLWEIYLLLFKRLPRSDKSDLAMTLDEFKKLVLEEVKKLELGKEFLGRDLNYHFSGGERKRLEMLQALIFKPKYAIFDEIDSGVDIDGLGVIKKAVKKLQKSGTAILFITHQPRILKVIKPSKIHVLIGGKIVKSGNSEILKRLKISGYKSFYCAACVCRETECPEHKKWR